MMAPPPGRIVAVFSTGDRQLAQIVDATDLRPLAMPLGDLASFSAGSNPLDLAIVDIRADNRLPDGLAHFKRRHPATSVVLVTASLDPTLILEGMRAGVSECLTEPLSAEALEAAIVRLTAQKIPEVAGQLFAFLGAKGGIGTTTVAVNVATALAATKHRTLFIDLHVPYGDAAVFFGAEPKFSVVDALEGIHRLDAALFKSLVVPTAAGVDLLASSIQGVVRITEVLRVRRLLTFALQHYRYVVVDCPRSDPTVLDALEAASRIVLVANQELATLRSGTRMAAMLRGRYRAERVMVVVSRFDVASEIGHDDVERVIGATVRHLVPSDYRSSLEALNRGKPVVTKNHSRLASALERLARELSGAPAPEAATPKPGGLLGRWTGKR
jgi:pilus assembly protein CpaE